MAKVINPGVQNRIMESGVIQEGFLEEQWSNWSLKDGQDLEKEREGGGDGPREGKARSMWKRVSLDQDL